MTADRESRLERICHEALALDGAARVAFVAEACAGDDALRREVESLLRQQSKADGFLAEPALMAAAQHFAVDSGRSLIGRTLGVYQIKSLLGAGGMGEVYRARDTTLGRDVAIKVLPPLLAADTDRLARFGREARMLAALNHPHIGAIYGVEKSDEVYALVMELVEGEDLAKQITRGPILVSEALPIAMQIAEALEAAHEAGLVHRDLKPANIKVTPAGLVKVLDFGLAKAVHGDTPDLTHSATMSVGGTRDGAILGTPAYMSPEQARGTPVDRRTDIWSFGCVLFEMLSGRPAFAGRTTTDILAAIIEREPDWAALPATAPPAVRRLLQRCLDKDPKQRLRDIGEARVGLEQPAPTLSRRSRSAYRPVGLIVMALVLLAAGVGLFYVAKPSGPVTSPSEYTQLTNFTDSAVAPSLSPDGRMVTFIRDGEAFFSGGQIYVKLLPNGESVRLTGDAHWKYAPVFTPDGSRIAYTDVSGAGWDTWTVPVLGGQPARLLPNASGLTWIADQRILFSEIKTGSFHMGIVTATESRAESRELYLPSDEGAMAHYSYASPDRRSVLVVEMNNSHAFDQPCRLVPFDGSSAGRQVGPRGTCTSAAWSPDGRWMYFGARVEGVSHLWRQKVSGGGPEQITFGTTEEEGVAVAPDGRSLVTSVGTRRSTIWIHDAAGERAISSEGYALVPRLSRSGTRVFYLSARDLMLSGLGWVASSSELRSVDLASGKTDSVLPGVSVTDYDISHDEKEVAFTTTASSGASQIWLASLDRDTPPRQVARNGDQVSFGAVGDLVFRSLEGKTNLLVRIKKDGTGRERISAVPILDKYGVSPDGEWIIISAPGSGFSAVPIHGGDRKKICGMCPGTKEWSPDGRFLYVAIAYAASRGRTLAIPVPADKSLPDLPASGITSAFGVAEVPGTRVIEHGALSPGPDPSTYVFTKTDLQRNLFRIPLH